MTILKGRILHQNQEWQFQVKRINMQTGIWKAQDIKCETAIAQIGLQSNSCNYLWRSTHGFASDGKHRKGSNFSVAYSSSPTRACPLLFSDLSCHVECSQPMTVTQESVPLLPIYMIQYLLPKNNSRLRLKVPSKAKKIFRFVQLKFYSFLVQLWYNY